MVGISKSIWFNLIGWLRLLVLIYVSMIIWTMIMIAKFIPIIDSYESGLMTFVWLFFHCAAVAFLTCSNIQNDKRKLKEYDEALSK